MFIGIFEKFASFHMLLALIHLNKCVANIEKCYYLRNSFSGEASIMVKKLKTLLLNYETTLMILKY